MVIRGIEGDGGDRAAASVVGDDTVGKDLAVLSEFKLAVVLGVQFSQAKDNASRAESVRHSIIMWETVQ